MNSPRRSLPYPATGTLAKLGSAVGFWRKRRGMLLAELAHRAGMSEDELVRLEAGLFDPGLDHLDVLARVLDVRLVELFQGEDANPGRTIRG